MILSLDTKSNDMSPECSPTLSQMAISIRLVNLLSLFFPLVLVLATESFGIHRVVVFKILICIKIMASSEQQVCVFLLLFFLKKTGYIQFNSYHF